MTTVIIVSSITLGIGFISGSVLGIRAGYMYGLDDVERMISKLPSRRR